MDPFYPIDLVACFCTWVRVQGSQLECGIWSVFRASGSDDRITRRSSNKEAVG